MKKIVFLTTTVLLFLAFAVSAQSKGPKEKLSPEQQANRMVERMTTDLNLNAKQQADLKVWYTASIKKRQENMAKNQDNREVMRASMKKDREETDVQLKKVLTADQYKKYKEDETKRREVREAQKGQRK